MAAPTVATPETPGKVLSIFISHKHEDEEVAEAIKAWLELYYGKDRMHIFLSEDISAGDDWYLELTGQLGSADILVLLYTDPQQEWDWPL